MTSDRLARFRDFDLRVRSFERIAGMYILAAEDIPIERSSADERDRFVRDFAGKHGFSGPDNDEEAWATSWDSPSAARGSLVEVLAGGLQIGHSRWDVDPTDAASLADAFSGFFGSGATYYHSGREGPIRGLVPSEHPDYQMFIFDGGCIAADDAFAAIFWIMDSD